MLVKNNSDKVKFIKDKNYDWINVMPGQVTDLPKMAYLQDNDLINCGDEDIVQDKSVIKYTEKEILDMNKADQLDMLKGFGLKNNDIKKLKREHDRVDKILELQQ